MHPSRVTLILLSSVFLNFFSFAQAFKKSEKIEIFGVKLKSKTINNQKVFTVPAADVRTAMYNPLLPVLTDELSTYLGSYRVNRFKPGSLPLFSLSVQNKHFPLLDSIDFDYYHSFGINILKKRYPGIEKEDLFQKFIKKWGECKTIAERRDLLFSGEYDLIKDRLVLSRFDIVEFPFTLSRKKVTKTTAELKAQLDTINIKDITAQAKVRAYIDNLYDEGLAMTGVYYIADMNINYVNKINYYISTSKNLDIANDEFVFNLRSFIDSRETSAINSGLTAIWINGEVDRTKVSVSTIESELKTKFSIEPSRAAQIAASIDLVFSQSLNTKFWNKFNNAFIIRYVTNKTVSELKFPSQEEFFDSRVEKRN